MTLKKDDIVYVKILKTNKLIPLTVKYVNLDTNKIATSTDIENKIISNNLYEKERNFILWNLYDPRLKLNKNEVELLV